jgi:O-antigen/teichoic acid export membrane protein
VVGDLRRRYGVLPFSVALPTARELKRAVAQSALYFVPSVTTPFVLNLPVIMLGKWANVAGSVVAFSVSRTLTGFVRQAITQSGHPIGAEMARQQALGDMDKLRRIFVGGGRLTSGLAGLLAGFMLVVAGPFLHIWTHGAVPFDFWLISAFLLTTLLTAPAQMALVLFLYNNRPGILIIANAGFAIGTVIFCALLIGGYSAAGAAAGTGLAEILSLGLLVPYAAVRETGLSLAPFLARCYLVAGAAFMVGWGGAWAVQTVVPGRNLFELVGIGITWVVIVALPAFFLLLSALERSWFLQSSRRHLSRVFAAMKGYAGR